jgi:hypothetical protein
MAEAAEQAGVPESYRAPNAGGHMSETIRSRDPDLDEEPTRQMPTQGQPRGVSSTEAGRWEGEGGALPEGPHEEVAIDLPDQPHPLTREGPDPGYDTANAPTNREES